MEVASGSIEDEMIDQLVEEGKIDDFEGVSYTYHETDSFASLVVKPSGSAPAAGNASGTESDVLAKYPYGKPRFNKTSFLMGHEEFVELFQQMLTEEGIPFTFGDPIPVSGGKQNYPVKYQQTQVGYLIVEESNGKVVSASVTYNIQDDETLDDYGVDLCLDLMDSAHGAMTAEDWTYVADEDPLVTRDEYVIYIYKLGGMKASMTVRAESYFLSVELED